MTQSMAVWTWLEGLVSTPWLSTAVAQTTCCLVPVPEPEHAWKAVSGQEPLQHVKVMHLNKLTIDLKITRKHNFFFSPSL